MFIGCIRMRADQHRPTVHPPNASLPNRFEGFENPQHDPTGQPLLLQLHETGHDPMQRRDIREIGNETRLFPVVLARLDVVLHDPRTPTQRRGQCRQLRNTGNHTGFGGQPCADRGERGEMRIPAGQFVCEPIGRRRCRQTTPPRGGRRLEIGIPLGGNHPTPIPGSPQPAGNHAHGSLGITRQQRIMVDERDRGSEFPRRIRLGREMRVDPPRTQRITRIENRRGHERRSVAVAISRKSRTGFSCRSAATARHVWTTGASVTGR